MKTGARGQFGPFGRLPSQRQTLTPEEYADLRTALPSDGSEAEVRVSKWVPDGVFHLPGLPLVMNPDFLARAKATASLLSGDD